MSDWQNDEEAKKQIMEFARQDYEANKDNPYAAIGYANVILALNNRRGIPIVPDKDPSDTRPEWVKRVHRDMERAFRSGNGRA